jgi:putative FmdB family regulatory protein
MPNYDVRCESCGKELEITHGINESHPKCECGGQQETVFNCVPLLPDTYSPMAPRRGRGRGIGHKSKIK